MKESTILKQLSSAVQGLRLPEPLDGRRKLKRNPGGKKWKSRDVAKLEGMVWHQELGWGSIEGVANYHTGKDSHLYRGGVESIAYTWAIRRDGQIVLCNDFQKATWAQGYKDRKGDENAEFMAVMYEGFFQGVGVTDSFAGQPNYIQMLSGLVLWHVCRGVWKWHDDGLYGHFHFGKPSCPGDVLEAMVKAVRSNAGTREYDFQTAEGRQGALKQLGVYTGSIDGIWGPASKGALIKFQKSEGLVGDGIWGPKTEAAVLRALKG